VIPDTPNLDQNNGNMQETVITPAGRLPKDRMKHVGPGQIIRRNKDGTYTVVKTQDRNKTEESGSKN